jgi:hypothetical protein
VIQVVEIPLLGSAQASGQAAHELTELPIDYTGDPDNAFDPAEHGLALNPLRACHDMTVFTTINRVAAACAEQSQLWEIDAASGLPDTADALWVFDQPNIDFHHSATFSWDGKVENLIDESFTVGLSDRHSRRRPDRADALHGHRLRATGTSAPGRGRSTSWASTAWSPRPTVGASSLSLPTCRRPASSSIT